MKFWGFISNWINYYDRTSRKDFWIGLIEWIIILGLIKSLLNAFLDQMGNIITTLIMLPGIPGLICGEIRRLHDAGLSGKYAWFNLIPILGNFAILILCLGPTDPESKWIEEPQV